MLEFKSNDAMGMQKLLNICFKTLIHLHDTTSSNPPAPDFSEFFHQVILLMRICSNIVTLENSYVDYIIDNWFRAPSRSLATFFNYFIEQMAAANLSIEETYWFIGKLMKCQLSETSLKYIEIDDFFVKIQMKAWCRKKHMEKCTKIVKNCKKWIKSKGFFFSNKKTMCIFLFKTKKIATWSKFYL